jgi:hypothetical protein
MFYLVFLISDCLNEFKFIFSVFSYLNLF